MKAVILAAGKGTRMGPLCATRPKPMLPVLNKPIMYWNMDSMHKFVDGYVIVVGYKGQIIKEYFGNSFKGKPIEYVEQKEQLGTAHCLMLVEGKTSSKFFFMMGDDFYDKTCFEKLAKYDNGLLCKTVEDPRNFGVVEHENGKLTNIVEKPEHPKSNLISIGLYVLTDKIFKEDLKNIKRSSRGELEIADAVLPLSKKTRVEVLITENGWTPMSFPWSVLGANETKIKEMKGSIDKTATIEKGATLKGEVFVGPKTIVKSGAYIEGPVYIGANCNIGPNCFLRAGTVIGDGCHVGNSVEIKNSVLFGNVKVCHLTYLGDSLIGYNCNLGAGTITANLRFDDDPVKVNIKGLRLSSERRKLGTIMGDGVKTGINTSIMPGVCIAEGSIVDAHSLVKSDINYF